MFTARAVRSATTDQNEPAEGGNFDISSSDLSGDEYSLRLRTHGNEATGGDQRWETMLFEILGARGLQPTFRLDYTNGHGHQFVPSLYESNVQPLWTERYPAQEGDWTPFDNYDRSSSDELVFSNNAVFSAERIFVSLKRRKTIPQYNERIRSDYVTRAHVEAPSTGGVNGNAFQVATQPGASSSSLGDSVSRDIGDEPIYTAVVREASRNPDKTALMTCGMHPFEHNNKLVMEGFFEFITSDDPKAQTYRSHFATICYFHLNPTGEVAGLWRGLAEDVTEDLNRSWNQNDQTGYQGNLETSIETEVSDLGLGDPPVALDLHQALSTATGYVRGTGSNTLAQNFQTAVSNYVSDMPYDNGPDDAGRFRRYTEDLYPGIMSCTMERAVYAPTFSGERAVGAAYAKALTDRAEAGDY